MRKYHLTVDEKQMKTMAVGVSVLAHLGEAAFGLMRQAGIEFPGDPAQYAKTLGTILDNVPPDKAADLTDLGEWEEKQNA